MNVTAGVDRFLKAVGIITLAVGLVDEAAHRECRHDSWCAGALDVRLVSL